MRRAIQYHCYLRDRRHTYYGDICSYFIDVELCYFNGLFSEPLLTIFQFDAKDDSNQTDGEEGEGKPLPEGNPPLRVWALPTRIDAVDEPSMPYAGTSRSSARRNPGDSGGDCTSPGMERRRAGATQGHRVDHPDEFDSRTTQFD